MEGVGPHAGMTVKAHKSPHYCVYLGRRAYGAYISGAGMFLDGGALLSAAASRPLQWHAQQQRCCAKWRLMRSSNGVWRDGGAVRDDEEPATVL